MKGFRGYVHSRKFLGERVPQHVQNIVIRDYCKRNNLYFLLSAVEYKMPETYYMLKAVIKDLPSLDGIIFYTMFQLPCNSSERLSIYQSILIQGAQIHFSLEGLSIKKESDIVRIENIWKVKWAMHIATEP